MWPARTSPAWISPDWSRLARTPGAELYSADLTKANLSRARLTDTDLRSVALRGANLEGVDLRKREIASGITTDLTGVNLTGAKLSRADFSNVNLTGANLTNVDLSRIGLNRNTRLVGVNFSGANVSGKDLRGLDLTGATLTNATLIETNLANAKLTGAKLDDAGLTGANLTGANLTGADLTGADLTRADLLRADLLNTILTRVVWKDTRCQYGGTTCTGCSNVPLPSEPPASWLREASAGTGKWQWYQYNGTGVVPDRNTTPMLRGTQDAPLRNFNLNNGDDVFMGIQGVIYNDTNQRVVVRTGVASKVYGSDFTYYANAILDPGGSVSYQVAGRVKPRYGGSSGQGEIEFLRYDNGQAIGDPAKLWLERYFEMQTSDGDRNESNTAFTPPGRTEQRGRGDWKFDEQHSEIWGSVHIDVKREQPGFRAKGSGTFKQYYGDPPESGDSGHMDPWSIFTIRIKSL